MAFPSTKLINKSFLSIFYDTLFNSMFCRMISEENLYDGGPTSVANNNLSDIQSNESQQIEPISNDIKRKTNRPSWL